MSRVKELTLIGWIERIFAKEGKNLITGIGDDCAVFRVRKGHDLFITTDTLVEGVHFKQGWTTPKLLGGKLANVNLSDIAAMGALPKYFLLSLSVTDSIDKRWMKNFLRGFKKSIEPYGSILIGGNVSASKELSFTVAVIGEAPYGEKVTRSGAREGDYIFVTGTPGDSALGLDILSSKGEAHTLAEKRLVMRHHSPTARVAWGRLLASRKLATAMIDISDGVALDLSRLLVAGGCGARVDLSRFPLSIESRSIVDKAGHKGWRRVLSGGEDYELLFTARRGKAPAIERLIKSGKIVAACIGQIVKSNRGSPRLIIVDPDGLPVKLAKEGWLHG